VQGSWSAARLIRSRLQIRTFAPTRSRDNLFSTMLVDALRAKRVCSVVLTERDAYEEAAARLRKSIGEVRRVIQNLGQSVEGPWRAEQKLAALAAWLALSR